MKDKTYYQTKVKFWNVMSKNHKSFRDFVGLCELEAKVGVDVGDRYCTNKQCRNMVSYIAEAQRCQSKKLIGTCIASSCVYHFFAIGGELELELPSGNAQVVPV